MLCLVRIRTHARKMVGADRSTDGLMSYEANSTNKLLAF